MYSFVRFLLTGSGFHLTTVSIIAVAIAAVDAVMLVEVDVMCSTVGDASVLLRRALLLKKKYPAISSITFVIHQKKISEKSNKRTTD